MMIRWVNEFNDTCCFGVGIVVDPKQKGAVFENPTQNSTTRLSFMLLTQSKNIGGKWEMKIHQVNLFLRGQMKKYEKTVRTLRRGDQVLFFGYMKSYRQDESVENAEITLEFVCRTDSLVTIVPGDEQETIKGERYRKNQIGSDIPFN